MHRRTALRAGAALLGVGGVGLAAGDGARIARRGTGQSASTYGPLSQLRIPGAREAVVGDDGRTVYLAVGDGFATVDVTDPERPSVLAERRGLLADREDGPMERIYDVAVDGDRLAVVGPASGTGLSGALLYDVSDPADPRRIAFHETNWAVHNCDLADGTLYLTGFDRVDNALVAVDLAAEDPEGVELFTPLDVDETWRRVPSQLRRIHDVTVADGVAYCPFWDAGAWFVDVSGADRGEPLGHCAGLDPETLDAMETEELLAAFQEPPGNAHYADVDDAGTLFALGAESWDDERTRGKGGPSGIRLFDVADPSDPVELSRIDPFVPRDSTRRGTWTTAHNFELRGDRLYSSWYRDGVKLHDVSDPTDPEELAHWRLPDEQSFWTAQVGRPGEFFVATDVGTRIVDDDDAGLFCFPDRPGTQPVQPSIPTATPWPTATARPSGTSTAAPSGTATAASPRTVTAAPSPTPSPSTVNPAPSARSPTGGSDRRRSPTATATPGAGALGALGALALAAWRRLG